MPPHYQILIFYRRADIVHLAGQWIDAAEGVELETGELEAGLQTGGGVRVAKGDWRKIG